MKTEEEYVKGTSLWFILGGILGIILGIVIHILIK